MFEFFKKKYSLIAPISGKIMNLSEVPDQVFAEKMAGDGIAIDSTGDLVVAPADGVLTLIFRTNHAFGITLDNGLELLVHIGLDTVALNGEGFERIAVEGTNVKAGDPIIKINREFLISKGCNLITPLLITNVDNISDINYENNKHVESGKDIAFTYKK